MNKEQILETVFLLRKHQPDKCPQWVDGTGDCNKAECDYCRIEKCISNLNQPANTTDSDSVFIGPEAGLDTGFIVPQPPKSAGVPNVQDRMQEIHHKFGTSEKANYEIQLFFDECLKAALTAQAQDFEDYIHGFAYWLDQPETQKEHGENFFLDLLRIYRNQKPRG